VKLGVYKHYTGNNYLVLHVEARHSETLEKLVVYRALYGDFDVWVRPQKMFEETVELNGKTVPRFVFLHS
jgi:hypothetical protein